MPLFDRQALNEGVARREVFAWAMYDFANSGYTTVVLTAIYSAYFVGVVAAGAPHPTTLWTWVLAVSNLLVMIAMPLLGAYADLRAVKKRLLAASTVGCVLGTAALAMAGSGQIAAAALAVVASNFFFMVGVALIAAFLPELARPQSLGKVSGWGWSFGYLGGMLVLGVCLGWILWQRGQGVAESAAVPATMWITAGAFALASLPTFLLLRERAQPQPVEVGAAVAASFTRLWATVRDWRRYRDFAALLACGLAYQAGVTVVIALAAIYAQEVMGFSFVQTIVLIFAVNLTAAIGAFAFGYAQDALGHRRALALTLCAWLAMTALAAVATTETLFWIAANLAGLAMGSSQSAGRAMVGLFAPRQRLAEFFGLWTLATQASAVIGPLAYGAMMMLTGNQHRWAILATGAFFVAGLVLIAMIDIERGRRAAADPAP